MFMLISTKTFERHVCPPGKIGKKPRSVSAPHIVIVEGGPTEYQNKEKYGPRRNPTKEQTFLTLSMHANSLGHDVFRGFITTSLVVLFKGFIGFPATSDAFVFCWQLEPKKWSVNHRYAANRRGQSSLYNSKTLYTI